MYTYTASELTTCGVGAAILLALNAIFVGAEFSLVKLRFTRFGSGRMKEARESERIAGLLEDMSASIKMLRLGISMFSIGAAFLILPLAYTLTTRMGWAAGYELRVSIGISLLFAVVAHFVLGELVPRAVALQHPVNMIRWALPFVLVFRVLSRPLSIVMNFLSGIVLKVFRLDPNLDLDLLDVQAQIRSLVVEGDELPALSESIVSNALELRKRVAHDIMIPRNQLQYIDLEDTAAEQFETARKTGHTRFPICTGDLDNCVGIVHIKDVFRSGQESMKINWDKLKRPMITFSMDEPLESVLQRFLKTRKHFALLKDEFGGTVGAVTLEDVLEELVGEIQDEFDKEEKLVMATEGGTFEVDGLTALHDLADEIGIELSADEVSTFGGYITYELGRMPKQGEEFRIKDLEIKVLAVDERRVLKAEVKVASAIVEIPVEPSESPSS
ncbi:HlyC/CorC family transporter [Pelagicoccus sp. NFK12]|uniref:HlyC/CorC family transporter n=1 Tax=Pelagicoccus enzymogenes TaxID=2773457 RepID=A0A927FB37_9BACT|nr:hemolysin family protein [Pelagicoccus enzymogenes]MBD5781717.1 HlyC/CorC family transporter [Pelagicoccus enzymogenes]MDQ8200003.1 hemolysin family protein [Pelagicoccus enzymogenes]